MEYRIVVGGCFADRATKVEDHVSIPRAMGRYVCDYLCFSGSLGPSGDASAVVVGPRSETKQEKSIYVAWPV